MPEAEMPLSTEEKIEACDFRITIPATVKDMFVSGNPVPLMNIIKQTCPKKVVERLYPSWKDIKRKRDKVALIGFADSKDEAPFKNDDFEVWGLNSLFEAIPMDHVTRWFEIHDRQAFGWDTDKQIGLGLTRDGKPYLEALGKLNCPVYMVQDYPDIPNSVRFPIEELITNFDPQMRNIQWNEPFKSSVGLDWNGYVTNSVSVMIGLALLESMVNPPGYKEIGIWGVDMATGGLDTPNGEYAHQRPSCEYYIGLARGMGIKVTIPPTADLLKTRFNYGWEQLPEFLWSAKCAKISKAMQDRLNAAQQNMIFNQKQMDQYIGALECIKEMDKIWKHSSYDKKFRDAFLKMLENNPELMGLI